ncbi:MAG: 50S ribosomal protein L5 [Armatimonadetes bacterium]|jgi:large subunit ribosomal protein L5|nr:50S ribosomal protein L5 [Armatimonadota bacterium]HOC30794.1 50S ribosomal protein L5 [Armatimonadota bacterium]
MARLKDKYLNEIVPALMKEFGFSSVMQAPKLVKVVINMGVGRAGQTGGDPKLLDGALKDLTLIAGQKPVVTKAKKSVAAFKIREGAKVGCVVTLRAERAYEFLDRLFNIALPRVRDFQGLNPNSFDGRGNFSFGLKEQTIFPEINYDPDQIRGMDIIIHTTARTDEEARSMLEKMGMPLRKKA